ncbi:hypothetical protein CDIK_3019 [Cucumispora dikerogammari]|nr:hypothetical protein CDIK_3019 [Cucumispora dikerogammari]
MTQFSSNSDDVEEVINTTQTVPQTIEGAQVTTEVIIKRCAVSNEDRKRIVDKTLEGHSNRSIANMFGLKYQTVNSIVRKYLRTGDILVVKRGGDRRSKITEEIKMQILQYVDDQCTRTLQEIATWVFEKFQKQVSISTIDRILRGFHYTVKQITLVPERRNTLTTIETRAVYANDYRILETNNDDKNFVFLDEVGFSVVARTSKGRSVRGASAYLSVPAARSRNISVLAAMNKYGMLYHHIQERAVNGEDFKEGLRAIKSVCEDRGILTPIFILDNARIHHYKGLSEDPEISNFNIRYLPPYSPFLNPIENVFSVWKNLVIRGEAKNESELRALISNKFCEITVEHCSGFYRKMLGYLTKCGAHEEILE